VLKIYSRISQKYDTNLGKTDIPKAVHQFLDLSSGALAENRRIETCGFGAFRLHRLSTEQGRNTRTGKHVDTKEKTTHYKPSSELRHDVLQMMNGRGDRH